MALFIGTAEEFNKFFKGYCKNKVNYLTRKERKLCNGICECCGEKRELQSAHKHALNRQSIISTLLEEYIQSDSRYKVDLFKFQEDFIAAHQPIRERFYFLCQDCHRKYDNNIIGDDAMVNLHK